MRRPWLQVLALGTILVFLTLPLGVAGLAPVRGLTGITFVGCILWRVRRDPDINRGPWLWIAFGGVLALVSAVVRLGSSLLGDGGTPFPSLAEIPGYLSYLSIINSSRSFWKHRSHRRDLEAGLDGFIVAAATAVVVFSAVLSDYLRDDAEALSARLGNLGYSILTIVLVGHVARLAIGPGVRNMAWRLLAVASALIVANDLLLLFNTAGSEWALVAASVTSPLAFAVATGAILHPDAGQLTGDSEYNPPILSGARLALLGAALLTLPMALLTALITDGDPDLPVLVVGSVVLAALTLGRIMMLFRARERIGDLEAALREAGRAFMDASSPDEMARATARTIDLVAGLDACYLAVIRSGSGTEHLVRRLHAFGEIEIRELGEGEHRVDLLSHHSFGLGEASISRLDLGEAGHFGCIVIGTPPGLDEARGIALQTMSAQIAQALTSLELREASFQRRTEQKLGALVEQSADLVLVVDHQQEVVYASPNSSRVIGSTPDALIGVNASQLAHPEDDARFVGLIQAPTSLHEMARSAEVRMRRPAFEDYRWFDVTARDFRDEPEVAGLVVTARDITEERTAKENLERSEAWFRSLVQSSSDVIAVLDDIGIITYISPAVMDLLGFDPDSLTGRSALEIIPGDELHRLDELRAAMDVGNVGSRDIELRLQAIDGTDRVVDITLSDLRDEPSVSGMVLNVRDITDRKALEHDLRHQALHDELTGLGNRLQFSEHLRAALSDPFERGTLAVVFVDVDDFKTVNDSLGHTAGDEVLMEVANRLRSGLRPTDRVSRLGGDEFAVLFTEIETDAELGRLADRLLQTLSWPVQVRGIDVQVLVSLGIATDDDRSHTAEDLLRSADVAMYQAKDSGKGRWALFEESMQAKARERFDLQNALSTALDDPREMVPHFQPIVDLATGRIYGVEALVRWFHPELGLVSPAAFIPLAEETGLIVAIGRHVLERSLAQLAAWHSQGHDIYVSVNISAVQLQTDGIVADILGLVDHHGVARHKVVLELTETALVNDFRSVITRIESLREAGIQVAIDDFGTGYSSLRYANEFNVDILKIDRTFVVDLEFEEQSTVISTIIELARHMGAKTVAEGIELPMMPPRLLRLGCELGQGYLFARPVPADVITVALEAEREGQTLVGLGR